MDELLGKLVESFYRNDKVPIVNYYKANPEETSRFLLTRPDILHHVLKETKWSHDIDPDVVFALFKQHPMIFKELFTAYKQIGKYLPFENYPTEFTNYLLNTGNRDELRKTLASYYLWVGVPVETLLILFDKDITLFTEWVDNCKDQDLFTQLYIVIPEKFGRYLIKKGKLVLLGEILKRTPKDDVDFVFKLFTSDRELYNMYVKHMDSDSDKVEDAYLELLNKHLLLDDDSKFSVWEDVPIEELKKLYDNDRILFEESSSSFESSFKEIEFINVLLDTKYSELQTDETLTAIYRKDRFVFDICLDYCDGPLGQKLLEVIVHSDAIDYYGNYLRMFSGCFEYMKSLPSIFTLEILRTSMAPYDRDIMIYCLKKGAAKTTIKYMGDDVSYIIWCLTGGVHEGATHLMNQMDGQLTIPVKYAGLLNSKYVLKMLKELKVNVGKTPIEFFLGYSSTEFRDMIKYIDNVDDIRIKYLPTDTFKNETVMYSDVVTSNYPYNPKLLRQIKREWYPFVEFTGDITEIFTKILESQHYKTDLAFLEKRARRAFIDHNPYFGRMYDLEDYRLLFKIAPPLTTANGKTYLSNYSRNPEISDKEHQDTVVFLSKITHIPKEEILEMRKLFNMKTDDIKLSFLIRKYRELNHFHLLHMDGIPLIDAVHKHVQHPDEHEQLLRNMIIDGGLTQHRIKLPAKYEDRFNILALVSPRVVVRLGVNGNHSQFLPGELWRKLLEMLVVEKYV